MERMLFSLVFLLLIPTLSIANTLSIRAVLGTTGETVHYSMEIQPDTMNHLNIDGSELMKDCGGGRVLIFFTYDADDPVMVSLIGSRWNFEPWRFRITLDERQSVVAKASWCGDMEVIAVITPPPTVAEVQPKA